MNYTTIISEILNSICSIKNTGVLPTYIPELSSINPNKFGIHLSTINSEHYSFGDSEENFSIQSISKVFSLCLAYKLLDSDLWKRVGVEPSGNSFNSLVQLEYEKGIPRNPFINAGAIVICDVLISELNDPRKELLNFIRLLAKNESISYSETIFESEKSNSFRNTALINLMKDFGNIKNNINDVLNLYFMICSIEMTCKELSDACLFLANYGTCPISKTEFLTKSKSKRINSIMQLCGFYDEAGEFSFKVGLPGKSGVGGGIVAVFPGNYSIAVWSPKLNKKGNSYLGMKFLEQFTTETKSSIF